MASSKMHLLLIGAVPAAAVFAGTGYYFGAGPKRAFAAQKLSETAPTPVTDFLSHPPSHAPSFEQMFPVKAFWKDDWDGRDPLSLLDPKAYDAADGDQRREILSKVKSTATRNLILIRHGQYNQNGGEKTLTALGREQADLLGKRLAAMNIQWDRVVMSTMIRATETALIVKSHLPSDIKTTSDPMLEEGAPYPPEPPLSDWRPAQKEFIVDGTRIEAAYRKYFHRAPTKQTTDSYELIICHANVIRYFVCRALQFPPEGWLRISLANTSITWIVIRPNGRVVLKALGDSGHLLPYEKTTYS